MYIIFLSFAVQFCIFYVFYSSFSLLNIPTGTLWCCFLTYVLKFILSSVYILLYSFCVYCFDCAASCIINGWWWWQRNHSGGIILKFSTWHKNYSSHFLAPFAKCSVPENVRFQFRNFATNRNILKSWKSNKIIKSEDSIANGNVSLALRCMLLYFGLQMEKQDCSSDSSMVSFVSIISGVTMLKYFGLLCHGLLGNCTKMPKKCVLIHA